MGAIVGSSGIQFSDDTVQVTKFDTTMDTGSLISIASFPTAGSYTWTKPSGCTKILVKLVGGGGGAAGYCESGGAGGYSEKVIDVTGVATVAVTVGGGGASVAYYTGAGDGGTTSFGAYCSATGGYGANRNFSHTGGVGGVGSNGGINLYGGGGTGHSNGSNHWPGGQGGSSFFGASAGVRRDTTSTKFNNGSPGTGGPGARTDDGAGSAGISNGEAGLVVVYSYK